MVAGNVIVSASSADLSLLKSTLTTLESGAGKSQMIYRIHDVCSKFYQIAVIVDDQRKQSMGIQGQMHRRSRPILDLEFNPTAISYTDYPMSQEDWGGILEDSHLEFGDILINVGEMATFVEPYMYLGSLD